MKNSILLYLLLAFLMPSCSPGENVNNDETSTTIVKGFYTCFNRHNWVKMANYYADSTLFLDPSYGKEFVIKTRQNIIDRCFVIQKEIPDVKDSIVNIVAGHDKVAVEIITIGTLTDGTKIKIPMCEIWAIKNGLIIKDACYYDN